MALSFFSLLLGVIKAVSSSIPSNISSGTGLSMLIDQDNSRLTLAAENIREEAQDKFLQYSTTHQQKASDDMAMNAGNRIDIKASKVKVN